MQVEQKKNLNVKFEEKRHIRKHNVAVAMCVGGNKDITPAKEYSTLGQIQWCQD